MGTIEAFSTCIGQLGTKIGLAEKCHKSLHVILLHTKSVPNLHYPIKCMLEKAIYQARFLINI